MIDIIIPAYNAHETIKQTLLSIALQTIKEKFNVYIINDCSIKDYSEEIKLFKKVLNIYELKLNINQGPGVARQFGIDNSNSQYILFLDSDDLFLDCFSVENLYNSMISDDYDMAIGVMVDETSDGFCEYFNHQGCLHGKMYSRFFIKEHDLKFNNTRNHEDNSFNKLYLLAEPKTIYCNDYIYLYRNNNNSITQSDLINYSFVSIKNFIYNMCWVIKESEKRNFNKKHMSEIVFSSYVYVYSVYLKNINRDDSVNVFKWMKDLHLLFIEYYPLLSDNKKLDILYEYIELDLLILNISFYDFVKLVADNNNFEII